MKRISLFVLIWGIRTITHSAHLSNHHSLDRHERSKFYINIYTSIGIDGYLGRHKHRHGHPVKGAQLETQHQKQDPESTTVRSPEMLTPNTDGASVDNSELSQGSRKPKRNWNSKTKSMTVPKVENVEEDGYITFYNITLEWCLDRSQCTSVFVQQSNKLKNSLPDGDYNKVSVVNGQIPVLFPRSIAEMPEIQDIQLNSIGLEIIEEEAFYRLPGLLNLSLQNNFLLLMDGTMFNNLPIKTLHLENNTIDLITAETFDGLSSLSKVYFDNNELTEYDPAWFKNSPFLVELHFGHNKIAELPDDAFENLMLTKKTKIYFEYNQLESVSPELFNPEQNTMISVLNLEHNNLNCIEGDFNGVLRATSLHISDNPMECDCVQRLLDYAMENEPITVSFKQDENCNA